MSATSNSPCTFDSPSPQKVGDIGGTKLQRYGPLGAILGIILVLVSFVVHGKWASTEESAQEIADLYVQNQDRVFMGSWLGVLGALSMLVFGMCMSQRVRDTGQQLLGMLVAGATLIAVAGMTVDSTLRAALSIQADNMSPEAMKTMHAIWDAFSGQCTPVWQLSY